MSKKIVGTVILDGIIEGKIENNKINSLLIEWIDFARSNNLKFYLETSGNSFSILADNNPINLMDFTGDFSSLINNVIEELIKIFPDNSKNKIFSTIRSTEYEQNLEIQSLYNISNNGLIDIQTREIETNTIEQEKPLTLKNKIIISSFGVFAFITLILISSLFVDYKSFMTNLKKEVIPLNVENIIIDNGFSSFLNIINIEKTTGNLIITLKRSDNFPINDKDFDKLILENKSLKDKITIESIYKGYIIYEYFDDEDHFIFSDRIRISGLKDNNIIMTTLFYDLNIKPSKIRLTYF
ncbi:MAG: hypothetical protein GY756_20305 [bacterium]|nr:hypothetical protein [bacterium]